MGSSCSLLPSAAFWKQAARRLSCSFLVAVLFHEAAGSFFTSSRSQYLHCQIKLLFATKMEGINETAVGVLKGYIYGCKVGGATDTLKPSPPSSRLGVNFVNMRGGIKR